MSIFKKITLYMETSILQVRCKFCGNLVEDIAAEEILHHIPAKIVKERWGRRVIPEKRILVWRCFDCKNKTKKEEWKWK
jgi:hypothetical protein